MDRIKQLKTGVGIENKQAQTAVNIVPVQMASVLANAQMGHFVQVPQEKVAAIHKKSLTNAKKESTTALQSMDSGSERTNSTKNNGGSRKAKAKSSNRK